jgi:O-antigen ligase
MSERLDKAIVVGLLVALVCTALTHGAVEAWSVAIFELVVLVLLLLWVIKSTADRKLIFRMPVIGLPLAALIILAAVQSIALTDEAGRRSGVSMDVEATRAALVVLCFLFLSFIIAANFLTTRDRLRVLANFLVVYGLAMAVFALIQYFAWDGRLFWMRPTTRHAVFGPFVNRNHFAGYMEMLLPLPVALIVVRHGRSELRMFYGFAAAMMGIAGFVSLSRGGMISIIAGLMFILFMSVRLPKEGAPHTARHHSRDRRTLSFYLPQGVAVLAIASAITAGVLWIGAAPVIDRVAESMESEAEISTISRSAIWKDTWSIFRASPVLGAGFGAFETVYPLYSRSDGSLIVGQSHNDYLQVLADCGVVGGAIALSFILLVFRSAISGASSPDPLVAGLAAGGGAGIFAMLVHSLFDFNLQLPSNALLFLLLAAVVSTTCTLSLRKERG